MFTSGALYFNDLFEVICTEKLINFVESSQPNLSFP